MGYSTDELFQGDPTPAAGQEDQNADVIDQIDHQNTDDLAGGDNEPPAGHDEGGEAPASQQGRKQVPLTALQEERQRRQEAAADLQREREQNRILQERMNQLLQFQQPQQPQQQQAQEPEIPSFTDDPEGHIRGLTQQFEKRIAELSGVNQQTVQQQQQAQFRYSVVQEAAGQELTFKQTNPDYEQATAHFSARKIAEYTALGMDPITAQQRVSDDYFAMALLAKQQGKNAPELIYNMAKVLGYTPGKGTPAAHQQQVPNVSTVNVQTSLGALPGAQTPDDTGKLTAAKVGAMSDAEFDKLCAEMKRTQGNQRPRV